MIVLEDLSEKTGRLLKCEENLSAPSVAVHVASAFSFVVVKKRKIISENIKNLRLTFGKIKSFWQKLLSSSCLEDLMFAYNLFPAGSYWEWLSFNNRWKNNTINWLQNTI
jgi:hypothetical protein